MTIRFYFHTVDKVDFIIRVFLNFTLEYSVTHLDQWEHMM